MKRQIIKIQKVRGQCLINIPSKMAKRGLWDVSEYAEIRQNDVGELFLRRFEDGSEEKEGFQRDRTFFDRQA